MSAQAFYSPKTVAEVVDLLGKYKEGAVIVNGGTDIVERLSSGGVSPGAIIYIRNVKELDYVREEGGHVAIGGIASYKTVQQSPACRRFTGLQEAVAEVGSPPIRNVATPAGNIGTAASGADCNVALMALGAFAVLASTRGERVTSLEEMLTSSDKALRPDELIREIRVPHGAAGSAFVKLAKRKAQDISQVCTCVAVEVRNGICESATVALGAVASRAVRAKSMEALIAGKSLDAALAALKGVIPAEASLRSPRNKPYKEAVISVIVARALKKAHAETSRSS